MPSKKLCRPKKFQYAAFLCCHFYTAKIYRLPFTVGSQSTIPPHYPFPLWYATGILFVIELGDGVISVEEFVHKTTWVLKILLSIYLQYNLIYRKLYINFITDLIFYNSLCELFHSKSDLFNLRVSENEVQLLQKLTKLTLTLLPH